MKNRIICVLVILAVAIIAGVGGYRYFANARLEFKAALEDRFGDLALRGEQQEMVAELQEALAAHDSLQAAALVRSGQQQFRSIFKRCVQRGLYLKYTGAASTASRSLDTASDIARVFAAALQDDFLQKDLNFCASLSGSKLKQKLEADLRFLEGYAAHTGENYDEGMRLYRTSLDISRKLGDRRRIGDNLVAMQHILYMKGHHKAALQLDTDALQKMGYRRKYAWSAYTKGLILTELGDVRQALSILQQGYAVARTIGDRLCEMNILERIANVQRKLGRFKQAAAGFESALAYFQSTGNLGEIYRLLNDRSLLYINTGHYSQARQEMNRALERAKEEDSTNLAIILLNIGNLHRILGEYEEAEICLDRALQLVSPQENFYDFARVLEVRGAIAKDRGDDQKAIQDYREALKTVLTRAEDPEKFGPQNLKSKLWLSLADFELQQGNLTAALNLYESALRTFQTLGVVEGIAHAQTRLGNALRLSGDVENAKAHFAAAIRAAEALGDPLLLSNSYFGMGKLYLGEAQLDSAATFLDMAVAGIEKTRQKVVGDDKINYFATAQDIYEEMIRLDLRRHHFASAFALSEQSRARVFRELFDDDEALQTPEGDGADSASVWVKNLQARLPKEVQIIEYKATRSALYIFALSRASFRVDSIRIGRSALDSLIFQFRLAIGADESETFYRAFALKPAETFNEYLRISGQLHALLIEPIAGSISADKINYIIPDGSLFQMPFAALVSSRDSSHTFLVEKYTLAYAPSVSILLHCMASGNRRASLDPVRMLVVGNPTGELNASEKEAREIARLSPRAKLMSGASVSERQVVEALEKPYDILHLAMHARIDEKNPQDSYLFFGEEEADDAADADVSHLRFDSRLHGREIFHLTLKQTQLVNLAGCKTASGRIVRGEGLIGMNRAFMKAGTPSILNSLWNIDDRHTAEIMLNYYKEWLILGRNKAEALRESQIAKINRMRQDPRFSYLPLPYIWAPFVLSGAYL